MSQLMLQRAKIKTRQLYSHVSSKRIRQHLKIADKSDTIIPFVPNPIQRKFAQNRTRRDLILKPRQVGMTTFCRAEDFVISLTGMSRQLVIADKADNTAKLRRMNERFYDKLPHDLQIGKKSDNAKTTIYSNGSEVSIDTAGGSSAGRASTFTRLHASEVAWWKDDVEVMSGIINTLGVGNGYAVAESTPNGARGWFYDECMKALEGRSVWKLHFFTWWEHPSNRLTEQQIAEFDLDNVDLLYPYTDEETELVRKHQLSWEQMLWRRYKMTEDPILFKQEHPEDVKECFLASGNSFFGDVSKVFTVPFDIGYNPNHRYVAGLDFGQDNDFTVMIVLDTHTMQQVDKLRVNQQAWESMRNQIKSMYHKWNVAFINAERNSVGSPNIEALEKDGINLQLFNTNAKTNPPLIQGLRAALHEHGLTLQDDSDIKHELNNFVSKQTQNGTWQYEGANGSHDDCVIALALAVHGMMNQFSVSFVEY